MSIKSAAIVALTGLAVVACSNEVVWMVPGSGGTHGGAAGSTTTSGTGAAATSVGGGTPVGPGGSGGFGGPGGSGAAGGPGDPSAPLYLYAADYDNSGAVYQADFQIATFIDEPARVIVDTICEQRKPLTLTCTNVRGFLSVTGTDEIRDMPANYGVPTAGPVLGPTGVQIDHKWAGLLDGAILLSLDQAGVYGMSPAEGHWTGSEADGSLNHDACDEWTTDGGNFTQYGRKGDTDHSWIAHAEISCESAATWLCLCW